MKKHDLTNIDEMRRKDRQVNDESWIVDYISKAEFGTFASIYEDQPFQTMTVFVYDQETHAIYSHTSKHGRLFANMSHATKVCFSIGEMGRLLPAEKARNFSNEYKSVVAFGRCEVMSDLKLARDKMHLMIEKYFPHLQRDEHYKAITKEEIEEIAVYKISIDSWTAKEKVADIDFPGALTFSEILQIPKS